MLSKIVIFQCLEISIVFSWYKRVNRLYRRETVFNTKSTTIVLIYIYNLAKTFVALNSIDLRARNQQYSDYHSTMKFRIIFGETWNRPILHANKIFANVRQTSENSGRVKAISARCFHPCDDLHFTVCVDTLMQFNLRETTNVSQSVPSRRSTIAGNHQADCFAGETRNTSSPGWKARWITKVDDFPVCAEGISLSFHPLHAPSSRPPWFPSLFLRLEDLE